jgi:hypothetical protein
VKEPKGGAGRGMSMLLILALLILIGGLTVWAWQDTPPDTPSAPATALPDSVPYAPPQN